MVGRDDSGTVDTGQWIKQMAKDHGVLVEATGRDKAMQR